VLLLLLPGGLLDVGAWLFNNKIVDDASACLLRIIAWSCLVGNFLGVSNIILEDVVVFGS
jgi:hypothetical protein